MAMSSTYLVAASMCGRTGARGNRSILIAAQYLMQDVDALAILPEADWANAAATTASHGILPRIESRSISRRSRVLLMRHTASGIKLQALKKQVIHRNFPNCLLSVLRPKYRR